MTACDVSVAIVGAGPHGLTVAAHPADRWPRLARDLVVFDPGGTWLGAWRGRFTAHQIPTLRSPGVHHPHPDPYGLVDFAAHEARTEELGDYGIPSASLFEDLCDWVTVEYHLGEVIVPVGVTHLRPHRDAPVDLSLSDGSSCRARCVVLAHNPATANIPAWVESMGGQHADEVELSRTAFLPGASVTVLGGGLTAAHLAVGAAVRGATTQLVARRPLRRQLFDTDPGWQGPKELDGYSALEDHQRRAAIDNARNGGSMPSHWMDALVATGVQVIVDVDLEGAALLTTPSCLWAATGSRFDAERDPLLMPLRLAHPASCHRGLPALTPDLRWPGTPIHLTGAYAGLRVGPIARNLAGARHAAPLIAESIARALGLAWVDVRHAAGRTSVRAHRRSPPSRRRPAGHGPDERARASSPPCTEGPTP